MNYTSVNTMMLFILFVLDSCHVLGKLCQGNGGMSAETDVFVCVWLYGRGYERRVKPLTFPLDFLSQTLTIHLA